MIPGGAPAEPSQQQLEQQSKYSFETIAANEAIIYKARIFVSMGFGIATGVFVITVLLSGLILYTISS